MLEVVSFILGPVQTNVYLLADTTRGTAAVVDPAWDGEVILAEARQRGWQIVSIWLTHAHFDHIGGIQTIVKGLRPEPEVAMHAADLSLWRSQGCAPLFGMHLDLGPEPTASLEHGQHLLLDAVQFEVRHVPGHTPGHVVYYCAAQSLAFCGDVIFQDSIGRTDLPGGDYDLLVDGIRDQILTMPDQTRLLCGHGPETTVGLERRYNTYLA